MLGLILAFVLVAGLCISCCYCSHLDGKEEKRKDLEQTKQHLRRP